jgi:hypothetical protein
VLPGTLYDKLVHCGEGYTGWGGFSRHAFKVIV